MKRERDDHFIFSLDKSAESPTGMQPSVTKPSQVIRCPDREELEAQLDHYSGPLWQRQVPDSTFARRFYVERVRPALRYYCRKFDVEVPGWLKNDSYFMEIKSPERERLFGPDPLRPREFTKFVDPYAGRVVKVTRGSAQ